MRAWLGLLSKAGLKKWIQLFDVDSITIQHCCGNIDVVFLAKPKDDRLRGCGRLTQGFPTRWHAAAH
jgi:hypothetical protein